MASIPGAQLTILPMRFFLSDAHTLVDTFLMGADHPTGIYAYNDEYAFNFDPLSLGERAVEMLVTLHKGQPLSDELSRPLMPQLIRRGST